LQRAKLAGGPVHPPGRGFELLRAYFDSTVHRRALNVYDLSPDRIGGAVDVAFIGALLLHLRDPVRALERVRECLTPGGRLVLFESVDAKLSKREEPLAHYMAHETLWTWWHPNTACVRAWAATAGFGDVRQLGTVKVRDGYRQVQTMATVHATA
jgi:SAM-dependent methyltransferase